MLHMILIFASLIITTLWASRLCVYKCDNDQYPNYCSDAIELCHPPYREFTINNISKLCELYGYQNLENSNSCELFRSKQQKRSLYCVYKCNQTHYPNLCLESGQVCAQSVEADEQCSLFHVPEWFENVSECNHHRKNKSQTIFQKEYRIIQSYNQSLAEIGAVTLGIRVKDTWNSATHDPVILSLIWADAMHQCTIFPFDNGKDYFCHTSVKYDTFSCDSPLNKSLYAIQIDIDGSDSVGIDKVFFQMANKNLSLEIDYFCFNSSTNVRNELNTYVSNKCANNAGFDAINIDSTPGYDYLTFVNNVRINLHFNPNDIESKEANIVAYETSESLKCFPEHDAKYILIDEPQSWKEAQQYCQEMHNSSLATIIDEKDFISLIALKEQKFEYTHSYFWIGMNDLNNHGVWVWADGTSCDYAEDGLCKNDIHWLKHQPDNYDPLNGEHCAAFYALSGYNDVYCGNPQFFFCNKQISAAVTNNTTKDIQINAGNTQPTTTDASLLIIVLICVIAGFLVVLFCCGCIVVHEKRKKKSTYIGVANPNNQNGAPMIVIELKGDIGQLSSSKKDTKRKPNISCDISITYPSNSDEEEGLTQTTLNSHVSTSVVSKLIKNDIKCN